MWQVLEKALGPNLRRLSQHFWNVFRECYPQTFWELDENFSLRMFSRTLGPNVQAMLSLNILRRLSENIWNVFREHYPQTKLLAG